MSVLSFRNKYHLVPHWAVIFFFICFALIKHVNAQGEVNYPNRPVKLMVTFPPGGAGDMTGRAVARGLQAIWNQAVVVENVPGGAGSIAAEMVVRAAPDGNVLFLSSAGPTAVLPFIRDKLTYDPLVDLTPIAMTVSIPNILVVSSKSNFKTFKEFVATAKSTPGGLNYASSGRGESHHMMMEYLMKATGIKLNEIPYKGGAPAVLAVSAGEVHAAWLAVSTALPLIRSGLLIGLAVSTQERVSQIPEIPSVSEQGFPGFDFSFWMGVMGPAKMPAALVKKIESDLRTVILSESYKEAIGKMGSVARFEGQEQFSKTLKDTYNRNKEALSSK
jgi:tripartite-type tricarboxylate transporter receptor subunit TctC